MATKKNPADAAVAFFESAPIDAAVAVLAICKGIVGRRQPARTKPRATKPPSAPATVADVITR